MADDSNHASNAKPDDYREAFKNRETYTKHTDPCAEASKATMACLERNNYDKSKCKDFFQTYNDCKKTWIEKRKADRGKGIHS